MIHCNCTVALALMTRLGAVNAGKMHGLQAARIPSSYSREEWLEHIAEEDRYLRPLIAEFFPVFLAIYDDDHAYFKQDLYQFGTIRDVERVRYHSMLEDYIATLLVDKGY